MSGDGPLLDRRTLLKSAGGAAVLGVSAMAAAEAPRRKRFAIVGLGSRARMYQQAITERYQSSSELVALCDSNAGRLQLAHDLAVGRGVTPRIYPATDFQRLLSESRPAAVIVTTPDATHDEYIVQALESGCDVITEKPLTTTADKAQRILEACRRSGRHVRVLFNYRYSPPRTQVKDLLMSNAIGDVLSVDFQWLLNTKHGADYFRRWHSQKKMSGGLMVHKATHHFDLVNWWLGSQPKSVMAVGKREFYVPAMAKRMGLTGPHERCRTCPERDRCSFFLDLAADPALKSLYLDQEQHDGYHRDRCVFRADIDIEDTMNVIVSYASGASLSYSLNAFNAWEGYRIAFNGTKGRLEHEMVEDATTAGASFTTVQDRVSTRIIPLRGSPQVIEPWTGTGGHGGGDEVMLNEIFGTPAPDKYRRAADERSGLYSILVGVAANRCFATGQAVAIADLVKGLTPPEVPAMPDRSTKIPMPART